MNILLDCLEAMPDHFSSKFFYIEARKRGYPELLLAANHAVKFLQRNAVQVTSRTWNKKGYSNQLPFSQPDHKKNVQEIVDAVKLLKSLGYKVMKPSTGWEEV